MNKQLGKKILLVLAAVMVMILLSSFKMQNEGCLLYTSDAADE